MYPERPKVEISSATRRRRQQRSRASVETPQEPEPLLGVVAILGFFFLVFFVVLFDRLEFDGIYRDHFKIRTALRAGDDFPLVHFIFFHIEIGLAFTTLTHNCLHPFGGIWYY